MDKVKSIVKDAMVMILSEQDIEIPDVEQTEIYGVNGILNSLAVIRLVVEIEERLLNDEGIAVNLTNENSFHLEKTPFKNYSTLCSYIKKLI
ncbi:hypothetical protein GC194_01225 [bacterium]|nr:hypothetical protein [bacterium]